jgi:hypothetical protein
MSISSLHHAALCEVDGRLKQENEWLERHEHLSHVGKMVFLCIYINKVF